MNLKQAKRIAVIDLGSNTNRLIIMETRLGYSYRLVDEVREVVRLQQGMTAKGLSEDAMVRGLSTLRLYMDFCQQTHVSQILATATPNLPARQGSSRRLTGHVSGTVPRRLLVPG